jgi:uncharacterized protein (TIGR00251 family)
MAGGGRRHHDQLSRDAICADGEDAILRVRVTPRARRSELAGWIVDAEGRDRVAVRLAAPPVDHAANKALVELIAALLDVPRSRVEIVSGELSRLKTLRIRGVSPGGVQEKLGRPRS